MRPGSRVIAVVLTVLSLSACGTLGGRQQPLSIRTIEVETPAHPGSSVDWHLLVETPRAAQPIAGSRIAIRVQPGEYGVLSGLRWADQAVELWQALIIRGFEDSGRIVGVDRPSASVRGDYALVGELRSFEYRRDSRTVAIDYQTKLVRHSTNAVLASRRFESEVAVVGEGAEPIMRGFDQAAAELLPELVDWTLQQGSVHWEKSPSR